MFQLKREMVSSGCTIFWRAGKILPFQQFIYWFDFWMSRNGDIKPFYLKLYYKISKRRNLSKRVFAFSRMVCLKGVLGLTYTFRRGNEASNLDTGVLRNLLVHEKGKLKQAHSVCVRLCWIYGRGVSGVAEELPSSTAQNGKSFGREV